MTNTMNGYFSYSDICIRMVIAVGINLFNIFLRRLQVNKKTSNRCKFSSVFHMSTEIYQIDINLLMFY